VLLLDTGSAGDADETVTVFVTVPGWSGTTTTVTVADLPAARLPSAQVSVGFFDVGTVQVPWLVVADLNVTLPGIGSLSETPVASEGPRFETGIV